MSHKNHDLYPTAEEIYVKCMQPEGDSLLHFSICYKFLASQVLLKGSKETEIGGLKIRASGLLGEWSVTFQMQHHNQSQVWLTVCGPAISISLNPFRNIR
jgi:hypothetical protein